MKNYSRSDTNGEGFPPVKKKKNACDSSCGAQIDCSNVGQSAITICSDHDGELGFGQGGSSFSKTCWRGDYQITSGEKTFELPKKHSSKFAKLFVRNLSDKIHAFCFYKNNFIRTTRLKFGQELKTT